MCFQLDGFFMRLAVSVQEEVEGCVSMYRMGMVVNTAKNCFIKYFFLLFL